MRKGKILLIFFAVILGSVHSQIFTKPISLAFDAPLIGDTVLVEDSISHVRTSLIYDASEMDKRVHSIICGNFNVAFYCESGHLNYFGVYGNEIRWMSYRVDSLNRLMSIFCEGDSLRFSIDFNSGGKMMWGMYCDYSVCNDCIGREVEGDKVAEYIYVPILCRDRPHEDYSYNVLVNMKFLERKNIYDRGVLIRSEIIPFEDNLKWQLREGK